MYGGSFMGCGRFRVWTWGRGGMPSQGLEWAGGGGKWERYWGRCRKPMVTVQTRHPYFTVLSPYCYLFPLRAGSASRSSFDSYCGVISRRWLAFLLVWGGRVSEGLVVVVTPTGPRKSKNNVPVSKYKVLKSISANKKEPSQSWGSIVSDVLKLVYQVENKNSKKNNGMYYPRFTKVIVDYFMAKDQAIPRRNKMFWHYAKDDLMFTTIRFISKRQDTQVYGTSLPQHLTNQAMLDFEAYKTYRAYATGKKTPKPKSTKKKVDSESSPKTKPTQASKGKKNQDFN
ncbi:hypothetical protein Tco_0916632 [Tanacetum coccineum]